MKTKIVLTTLALSLSVMAFAQEKTILEKRITNYSIKIDSIVSSEKMKMNLELNEIEKNAKDGKISDVEMQSERTRISSKYEQIINEKIDSQKGQIDEITKASAMNSVMGKEDDTANSAFDRFIKDKTKGKNPIEKLRSGGILFSLGRLNLVEDKGSLDFFNNPETIRAGKSGSYSITSVSERQIGKYKSPVFINYGLGIRVDTYTLKNNQVFTQSNNQLQLSTFNSGNLKYSILRESYLEIPVNVNFVLNPKYVDYAGEKVLDADERQFRFGVGIYGGVRIGNRIRYKYSNAESGKNIFIQKVENGVNPFIFGTKLSIGYSGFSIYVKKDLVPVFNNDADIKEKNSLQIGLELLNFNF